MDSENVLDGGRIIINGGEWYEQLDEALWELVEYPHKITRCRCLPLGWVGTAASLFIGLTVFPALAVLLTVAWLDLWPVRRFHIAGSHRQEEG